MCGVDALPLPPPPQLRAPVHAALTGPLTLHLSPHRANTRTQVEAEAPRLASAVAAARADLADVRISEARYLEIKEQPQARWTLREAVGVRIFEELRQLTADLRAASEDRERSREVREGLRRAI